MDISTTDPQLKAKSDKPQAIIWDFKNTLFNTTNRQLFPRVKELLRDCHVQYKQAVVSTTLDDSGRRKLISTLGIAEFFDLIETTPRLKSVTLFRNLCKQLKCNPEDCYVIGDSVLNEIRIGNELGMKTIWIARKSRQSLIERILGIRYWRKVNNLEEVRKTLE